MSERTQQPAGRRIDIPSMEADLAFFEARLSLADHAPDTAYQRAQTKAYQTLRRLFDKTLESARAPRQKPANGTNAA